MKQIYQRLVTLLFCVFIGGVAVLSIVLPDRSFSEMENRNLRAAPELTWERLRSGRFMTEAEDYLADQIAFRDGWVALKALAERLTGKQENNGIYFGEAGTLISRVDEPDETLLDAHIQNLDLLVEQTEVPVYFGLIPSAASVWQARLPKGAPTADEAAWTQTLYRSTQAQCIDIAAALAAHSNEAIYYCTDHHWTTLGACYGAGAILEAMGLEGTAPEEYETQIVCDDFYGTNYSAACAWWTEPDSITVCVPEEGKTVVSNFTGREEPGRLYVPEQLEVKNKYAYFLGGNQPLCVIRSQADGPAILVIRDSYADCLAPFLAERCAEVHLYDLRYNRMSVQEYIETNEIDAVLVLYSFANYIADENQFLLAR